MSKNKKARGDLSISVYVNCPNCDHLIDMLDESDTDGYNHNEEGAILEQACPDGYWRDAHGRFEITGVTCTQCKNDFDVIGLDW